MVEIRAARGTEVEHALGGVCAVCEYLGWPREETASSRAYLKRRRFELDVTHQGMCVSKRGLRCLTEREAPRSLARAL